MISFEALVEARPLIHRGREITWGISMDLAAFLDEYVQPWHVTLETGSGLTIVEPHEFRDARHAVLDPEVGAITDAVSLDAFGGEMTRGLCHG